MSSITTITPTSNVRSHRKKPNKKFSYLTHVDGIRGLAIGLVVFFHVFIGKVSSGVDVFLFIGGLLFVSSQMRNAVNIDGMTFTQSFIRMIRRLAPALVTVVSIISITSLFIYSPADWWKIFRDASSSVTYVINWTFGLAGESYIAAGQEASLFQHMWSMSVQMQIYLIMLVIIYSSAKVFRVTKDKDNSVWEKNVYITITMLTVASFVYASWMVHHNQTVNYYSTFTRFWEIGIGSIIGALLLSHLVLVRWIRYILGITGLLMIVLTGVFLNGTQQFPGYMTLIPITGAFFLIIGGQLPQNEERTWKNLGIIRIFETRVFKFLGNISYSLYLWHWPLLILFIHESNEEHVNKQQGIIIIVASIILAYLTFQLVEKPLRQKEKPVHEYAFSFRYMRNSIRKSDTIWKPAAAFLLTIMSALLIASPSLLLVNTKVQAYMATQASEKYGGFFNAYPGARSLIAGTEVPEGLDIQPNPVEEVQEMMPVNWKDGCYTEFGGTDIVFKKTNGDDCAYGDVASKNTLYVIGGSHSEQYMTALDDIGKRRNIRVIPIIKMGCPMINEGKWDGTDFSDCDIWADKAMNWILDNPPTMGVFITSTRPQTILGKGTDMVPANYHDIFKRISDKGIHIYAVRDNPWLMNTDPVTGEATDIQKDAKVCVSNGGNAHDCGVPQKNTLSDTNPSLEAYKDIPNITQMDFTPIFCQDGWCNAVIGNVLVYRDSHHLTDIFVKSMIPFIENEMLGSN